MIYHHKISKYLLSGFIIASLFLAGCANSAIQNSKTSKLETNDLASDKNYKLPAEGELPEKDCLGLTAENVQNICGSGPLQRNIKVIRDGYECEYQAVDSINVDGPKLGNELRLAYFSGPEQMADLKAGLKNSSKVVRIGDLKNGFYAAFPRWAESTRKTWTFDFYRQLGPLTAILYGTEIDYEPMDLSQELGCSFSEMWNLLSTIAHEDLSGERVVATDQISKEIAPPAATPADQKNTADCCTMMIAEVKGEADVRHNGKTSPAVKGQILSMGDEIITGDDSEVSVALFNCNYGDNENNYGLALVRSDSMGSIAKTSDGRPTIFFDPGVANVSVKELQTFETDFQVSTPRLTCSTRG